MMMNPKTATAARAPSGPGRTAVTSPAATSTACTRRAPRQSRQPSAPRSRPARADDDDRHPRPPQSRRAARTTSARSARARSATSAAPRKHARLDRQRRCARPRCAGRLLPQRERELGLGPRGGARPPEATGAPSGAARNAELGGFISAPGYLTRPARNRAWRHDRGAARCRLPTMLTGVPSCSALRNFAARAARRLMAGAARRLPQRWRCGRAPVQRR